MNQDNIIVETLEFEHGIKAKIVLDQDPQYSNPRDCDNLEVIVCWHSRHNLGDKHKFKKPRDFVESLTRELFPEISDNTIDGATMDALLGRIRKKALICPLNLYDHSGISISLNDTYPYDDPWDAGQVGWIYVTHQAIRENWCVRATNILVDYKDGKPPKTAMKRAVDMMESAVDQYDEYIQGNVYGYQITVPPDEMAGAGAEPVEVDSCWGHIGLDWAKQAAAITANHYVKKFSQSDRMAGAGI